MKALNIKPPNPSIKCNISLYFTLVISSFCNSITHNLRPATAKVLQIYTEKFCCKSDATGICNGLWPSFFLSVVIFSQWEIICCKFCNGSIANAVQLCNEFVTDFATNPLWNQLPIHCTFAMDLHHILRICDIYVANSVGNLLQISNRFVTELDNV